MQRQQSQIMMENKNVQLWNAANIWIYIPIGCHINVKEHTFKDQYKTELICTDANEQLNVCKRCQ